MPDLSEDKFTGDINANIGDADVCNCRVVRETGSNLFIKKFGHHLKGYG